MKCEHKFYRDVDNLIENPKKVWQMSQMWEFRSRILITFHFLFLFATY